MTEASIAVPRRQLSAILFADVHGYSRLTAKNEDRTYQRVIQAVRLIRSLIGDYGGHVQHVAGDGILALFECPLRRHCSSRSRSSGSSATRRCGRATTSRSRFASASTSARCCSAARPASRVTASTSRRASRRWPSPAASASPGVQRAVRDTVGIAMRQLGPQSPKNIAEPVEVFAIEVNGAAVPVSAELPPTPSEIIKPFAEASVAVLPLDNLSNDPRNGHLCDGITGDIITNLSRFRDLLVIARHSAFLFRNHDAPSPQIAGPLGVRYLMTGGLQRSGRKIRLRVQLTEAETDRVIWSDRYDGTLGDLFAFQDDVTATIAARLAVQISAPPSIGVCSPRTCPICARMADLRGQDLGLRFRKEANLHARRLFEHAAELDPDYGRCYAGMSRTFNLAWRYHWTPNPELALDKAVDLANVAISDDNWTRAATASWASPRCTRRA